MVQALQDMEKINLNAEAKPLIDHFRSMPPGERSAIIFKGVKDQQLSSSCFMLAAKMCSDSEKVTLLKFIIKNWRRRNAAGNGVDYRAGLTLLVGSVHSLHEVIGEAMLRNWHDDFFPYFTKLIFELDKRRESVLLAYLKNMARKNNNMMAGYAFKSVAKDANVFKRWENRIYRYFAKDCECEENGENKKNQSVEA